MVSWYPGILVSWFLARLPFFLEQGWQTFDCEKEEAPTYVSLGLPLNKKYGKLPVTYKAGWS